MLETLIKIKVLLIKTINLLKLLQRLKDINLHLKIQWDYSQLA
jgi:hypothetical protein